MWGLARDQAKRFERLEVLFKQRLELIFSLGADPISTECDHGAENRLESRRMTNSSPLRWGGTTCMLRVRVGIRYALTDRAAIGP